MKNIPITGDMVIVMTPKGKQTTKLEGSMAAARYQGYRDGMTVNEAKEAGLRHDDFRWDRDHGHIVLKTPDEMDKIVGRYIDRALAVAKSANANADNVVWIETTEDD